MRSLDVIRKRYDELVMVEPVLKTHKSTPRTQRRNDRVRTEIEVLRWILELRDTLPDAGIEEKTMSKAQRLRDQTRMVALFLQDHPRSCIDDVGKGVGYSGAHMLPIVQMLEQGGYLSVDYVYHGNGSRTKYWTLIKEYPAL